MFKLSNTKILFLSNNIISKFEEKNLDYPYSIISIVNNNNIIDTPLVDMIINNLELYFHHINKNRLFQADFLIFSLLFLLQAK